MRGSSRVVLMYHRVHASHVRGWMATDGLNTPLDQFEQHIEALQRNNFRIVSPHQFFDNASRGQKILITVDDAYREIYTELFPVLLERAIPVLLFVPTAHLRARAIYPFFLFESLERAVNEGQGLARNLWQGDLPNASKLYHEYRQRPMECLQTLGLAREPYQSEYLCSEGELKEMLDSGIVFLGSHTETHPYLPEVSARSLKTEIMSSFELLKERLGVCDRFLGYPFGGVDLRTMRFCRRHAVTGFTTIDSCNYRNARLGDTLIPRLSCETLNQQELLDKIHGGFRVSTQLRELFRVGVWNCFK